MTGLTVTSTCKVEKVLPWLMLPLFAGLLVSAYCNHYAQPPVAAAHVDEAGFRARLRRPEVIAFFAAAFLIQVSFGPYYTFFSIYLGEHGYAPSTQGLLWGIGVLVEIVLTPVGAIAEGRRP